MSVTTETGQRLALDQRLLDTSQKIQLAADVSAEEDSGTIKGTACRYGVALDRGWGLYLELVAGCFAGAMKDPARVKVLWQHDTSELIGHMRALDDGEERLRYTGWIDDDDDVPTGRLALRHLRTGSIDQVSVGFSIQKYARVVDEENDTVTYRILKAWLMELSIVTWGAFGQDATVEEVFAQHAPAPPGPEPAAARAGALQAARVRARMAAWT